MDELTAHDGGPGWTPIVGLLLRWAHSDDSSRVPSTCHRASPSPSAQPSWQKITPSVIAGLSAAGHHQLQWLSTVGGLRCFQRTGDPGRCDNLATDRAGHATA